MIITWLGHSCFKIEEAGYTLIIDPYEDGYVPGLLPVAESADQVRCSHEHGDHNGRGAVTLNREEKQCPFTIEIIDTYHDEVQGAKRGINKIYIISDGKQRVAHFGDIGCELTGEQKEKLADLDVALLPVGGYYTIDAKQAADMAAQIRPKHIIPMHYRDDQYGFGFPVIGTAGDFAEYMDSVTSLSGSSIDTSEDYDGQVLILVPLRAARG